MAAKKISIIGSGNWGSVIAKIVGNNARDNPKFDSRIPMYVYEEMVDGRKLTEIINEQHENTKYLPGCKLPDNVVAIADIVECAKDADILIFVVPHQFVKRLCSAMKGNIKSSAIAVSLIKGLDVNEKGLDLISNVISTSLGIDCSVCMGANIAKEVAEEHYCEATIGCRKKDEGLVLKEMFQTPYFRIVVVEDADTVELCGALKNIVAVGAGFTEGLKFGDNTKAAVIRLGLMEIIKFVEKFYSSSKLDTFLQSCGVADLVTTCYQGRNKRVACAFAAQEKHNQKSIEDLEREMLAGQKLQGPLTASEVNAVLKKQNMEDQFPLFTAVHRICIGELTPSDFITCLKDHPEHM